MDPRSPKDSQTELSSFMHPEDANSQGNVHGGSIMKLVDEAGALAAMRHSRRPCVTVAIDSVTFGAPLPSTSSLRIWVAVFETPFSFVLPLRIG